MTDPVVLYILMRTDLASMNPGKAMAQANHAYGALQHAVRSAPIAQPIYLEWTRQTDQDFGTTIVLGGDVGEIERARACAVGLRKLGKVLAAGWVHDPTYPLRDGTYTHLIPLDTCAFIFGRKSDAEPAVRELGLHA